MKWIVACVLPLLFCVPRPARAQRWDHARVAVSLPASPIDRAAVHPEFVVVSHERNVHILIGMASGLVIGATLEAVKLNADAKRCHSESCQVQAADGLAIGIMGVGGAAIGGVIGALWPVRDR